MKTKMKRILGILLTLTILVGMVPELSLTALAWDGNPYDGLVNTTTVVHFDGKNWYLIKDDSTAVDAGTVTLLAEECVTASQYDSSGSCFEYNSSTVKTAVDNWYNSNITAAAKTAVNGNGMFLLTTAQAQTIKSANADVLKCSRADNADGNFWWLRSLVDNSNAACVYGDNGDVINHGALVSSTYGVRPALKLDLSSVIFESGSKTFSLKPYASLIYTTTPVHFDSKDWYLIGYDSSTVTLLAKECVGASKYNSSESYVEYDSSTVKTAVDDWYNSNITAAAKPAVNGSGMFLLTTAQAQTIKSANADVLKCSRVNGTAYNGWWLCSRSIEDLNAACVDGGNGFVNINGDRVTAALGIRPALKLDLSSVFFESGSKTFSLKLAGYSVTITPAAKTLTYTGSAQSLVEAGTAEGGTIQYALGTATKATEPYTTSIPTATDAGTYYVWYKVVGDGTHMDTEAKCVKVTIAEKKDESKAEPVITPSDNKAMDVKTETIDGGYQVTYAHQIPFPGKGKLTAESFGENFTVSQGNESYKVKKIKANKKKHRIQILKLENAPKDVEKAVKKATKGNKGIPYTQNPYYVRDTDKVTPKFKKSGAAASVKVNINGKDYKAKKTEYDYNEASKLIIFKGDNLAGSWTVK